MHHMLTAILVGIGLLLPTLVWAQANLENPAPDSSQSGIGIVSGWKCTAGAITVSFDNGAPFQAAYGTARGDTASVCGDANNGFGLLVNWNLLGDGTHTVRVFADGAQFASATFTVATLGAELLRGLSGEWRIPHFPWAGTDTIILWQESLQNLAIAGTTPSTTPPPPNFNGAWSGRASSSVSIARSGAECRGANIELIVSNTNISGSVVTDWGYVLALSGAVSSDGLLGGEAQYEGNFAVLLTGALFGQTARGQWMDVLGCWGTFWLQRR